MKQDIVEKITVPEDVNVELDGNLIRISSGTNRLERKFVHPKILLKKDNGNVVFSAKNATKREKMMINSFKAHMRNMMRGVKSEYVYRLAVCSSHFPMTVSVEKNEVVIKNFLGERMQRRTKIFDGVHISVEGNMIIVKSCDKEKAGQMAGNIEILTKIKNKDRRVFQDGCYIFDKAGKIIK